MARDTYGDLFAKIVNTAIIVEHLGVVIAYMVLVIKFNSVVERTAASNLDFFNWLI